MRLCMTEDLDFDFEDFGRCFLSLISTEDLQDVLLNFAG